MNLRPIREHAHEHVRATINIFTHRNRIDIANQIEIFGKALNHRLLLQFLAECVILIGKTQSDKFRLVGIAHLHELHFAIAVEEVHVHGVETLAGRKLLADILDGPRLEHAIFVNAADKLIDIYRIRYRILDIAFERFAK